MSANKLDGGRRVVLPEELALLQVCKKAGAHLEQLTLQMIA